jgi:hypothetical protein
MVSDILGDNSLTCKCCKKYVFREHIVFFKFSNWPVLGHQLP